MTEMRGYDGAFLEQQQGARQGRRVLCARVGGDLLQLEKQEPLMRQLTPENYRAKPERVLIFRIAAWDTNCPQHIPKRFEAEDVERALAECNARIAELEDRLSRYEDPSPVDQASAP